MPTPSTSPSADRPTLVDPGHQATGILTAITLLRAVLLAWATVVVVIDIRGTTLIKSGPAVTVLVILALWTAVTGTMVRHRSNAVLSGVGTGLDVALASVVAGLDDYIYDGPHPQTFVSAWPLCAAIAAGSLHGATVGAVSGAVMGVANGVGIAVFDPGGLDGHWMSVLGTMVLLTVAGLFAGRVTAALQRAEMISARATVREDVARQLHDGVLQTLAAVQRRSDDASLVDLARDQELDLRHYIDDDRVRGPLAADRLGTAEATADVVGAVRATLTAAERRTGLRCELVIIDTATTPGAARVDALCGAVAEAITNAHKHADASRVVVCLDVEPRGGTLCTVNDDGCGFDPASTTEGVGISRSIRARLDEVGGSAVIHSSQGHGTEVQVRVP